MSTINESLRSSDADRVAVVDPQLTKRGGDVAADDDAASDGQPAYLRVGVQVHATRNGCQRWATPPQGDGFGERDRFVVAAGRDGDDPGGDGGGLGDGGEWLGDAAIAPACRGIDEHRGRVVLDQAPGACAAPRDRVAAGAGKRHLAFWTGPIRQVRLAAHFGRGGETGRAVFGRDTGRTATVVTCCLSCRAAVELHPRGEAAALDGDVAHWTCGGRESDRRRIIAAAPPRDGQH